MDNKIKSLRKRLGMTQLELAYEVGVTPYTVHVWEKKGSTPHKLAQEKLDNLKKYGKSTERKWPY